MPRSPVFVDGSRRRRWRVRLVLLAAVGVGVGLLYTGLVVLSLLGDPVRPGPATPDLQPSVIGDPSTTSSP